MVGAGGFAPQTPTAASLIGWSPRYVVTHHHGRNGDDAASSLFLCNLKLRLLWAFSQNEQVSAVLCVDPPVTTDRERRISGAERKLQEQPLDSRVRHIKHAGVALRDHIGMSVFARYIHIVVNVNGRGINTPLKAVRVIGNALQRPV